MSRLAATKPVILLAFLIGGAASLAQTEPAAQELALQPPPPPADAPWREAAAAEPGQRVFIARIASARPSGVVENDRFNVEFHLPAESVSPPPVVILLNYWGASDLNLERSLARLLAERGVASAIMPLPWHLGRTPQGSRSGEYALRPNVQALRETLAQSLSDARRVIDFIQLRPELDGSRIGIHGTSLGSMVGSLVFGVEARVSAGSFLLGGADLASILWRSSRAASAKESLRRQGWTEESLRAALADLEPLGHLRRAPKRPSLIIRARHDSVVPPENGELLQDALQEPSVILLDTGHYGGFLVQNPILRQIAGFFQASFAGQGFSAPSRFYSPTIRLGLYAGGQDGVQVGAGLDLWRTDDGRAFAAAVLAPKGLSGYLGLRWGGSFSAGVSIKERLTWGAFWSTVL
jgi:dienelactone hydrolase